MLQTGKAHLRLKARPKEGLLPVPGASVLPGHAPDSQTGDRSLHRPARDPVLHRRTKDPIRHRRTEEPVPRRRTKDPVRHKRPEDPVLHSRTADPVRRRRTEDPLLRRRTAGHARPRIFKEHVPYRPADKEGTSRIPCGAF